MNGLHKKCIQQSDYIQIYCYKLDLCSLLSISYIHDAVNSFAAG